MASHLHEVLVEMFRDRPVRAAELLAGPLGVSVPAFHRFARGHTATATVVGHVTEPGMDDSVLYYPVVDLVTRDGQIRSALKLNNAVGKPLQVGRVWIEAV